MWKFLMNNLSYDYRNTVRLQHKICIVAVPPIRLICDSKDLFDIFYNNNDTTINKK